MIGTSGEAPESVILVENVADAETVEVSDPDNVALTTQTTLSIDDTMEIVEVLRRRFPALWSPKSSDICYATQNRQDAVREVVQAGADLVLVVGSRNSSNSNRMVEVAQAAGCEAHLLDNDEELDPAWLEGKPRIALTAGASAPEVLVQERRPAPGGGRLRPRRRGGAERRGRVLRPPPRGPHLGPSRAVAPGPVSR